jgi:hypothetical protein
MKSELRDIRSAIGGHTPIDLIPNYPFYRHPPYVALLNSRAVVDPALPMMIMD